MRTTERLRPHFGQRHASNYRSKEPAARVTFLNARAEKGGLPCAALLLRRASLRYPRDDSSTRAADDASAEDDEPPGSPEANEHERARGSGDEGRRH